MSRWTGVAPWDCDPRTRRWHANTPPPPTHSQTSKHPCHSHPPHTAVSLSDRDSAGAGINPSIVWIWHGCGNSEKQDWYLFAEQPAPAPHLAHQMCCNGESAVPNPEFQNAAQHQGGTASWTAPRGVLQTTAPTHPPSGERAYQHPPARVDRGCRSAS